MTLATSSAPAELKYEPREPARRASARLGTGRVLTSLTEAVESVKPRAGSVKPDRAVGNGPTSRARGVPARQPPPASSKHLAVYMKVQHWFCFLAVL